VRALVGDIEHGADVAKAEPPRCQLAGGSPYLGRSLAARSIGLISQSGRGLQVRLHRLGQVDPKLNLDRLDRHASHVRDGLTNLIYLIEELVSSVTGTYLQIVGSGDAAHLCVRLLSHASDGRCALIDPPVVTLLPPVDQDEMLEAGMQVVSEMPNLRGPLEEVTNAQEAGYSEEDRLRILISALEDSDLPGDDTTRAEIQAMLQSYRSSLERGEARDSEDLEPWWFGAVNSARSGQVKAWFPVVRHLPDIPSVEIRKVSWAPTWWQESSEDAAAEVAHFLQDHPA
jgi:hypothetical protein